MSAPHLDSLDSRGAPHAWWHKPPPPSLRRPTARASLHLVTAEGAAGCPEAAAGEGGRAVGSAQPPWRGSQAWCRPPLPCDTPPSSHPRPCLPYVSSGQGREEFLAGRAAAAAAAARLVRAIALVGHAHTVTRRRAPSSLLGMPLPPPSRGGAGLSACEGLSISDPCGQ